MPRNNVLLYILQIFVFSQRSWGTSLREKLQRNARTPPMPGSGRPLAVRAGMYIESLGKFQSTEMVHYQKYNPSAVPKASPTHGVSEPDDFEPMSFDVDLYLYLSWKDSSLNHSNSDYVLINDPIVREQIWLPDLYFTNARTSKFHEVTVPNFNLFIAQDGTIAYSCRITLNVACNLNLVYYPMDRQKCAIRTVSYAYIEKQINVSWFVETPTTKPIRYNPAIELPEFNILNILPSHCNGTYQYAIMDNSYKIDKFSCLEANIYLSRSIGYHLVQSFIPTGLIVMISWVSFWIDRRAVPARVTLSFTTLLSLSTLGNGLRFGLPQVSYAKSIDFWFGSCMFFIFLSLLEFAAVNSYMRQSEKFEKMANSVAKQKTIIPELSETPLLNKNLLRAVPKQSETGFKSDKTDFYENSDNIIMYDYNPSVQKPNLPNRFVKKGTRSKLRFDSLCHEREPLSNDGYCQCENSNRDGGASRKANFKDLLLINKSNNFLENSTENNGLTNKEFSSISFAKSNTNVHKQRISLIEDQLPMEEIDSDKFRPLSFSKCDYEHLKLDESYSSPTSSLNNYEEPIRRRVLAAKKRAAQLDNVAHQRSASPFPKSTSVSIENHNSAQINHYIQLGFFYSSKGLLIDKWSRILFPALFILFNMFYWIYYLWYIQNNLQ